MSERGKHHRVRLGEHRFVGGRMVASIACACLISVVCAHGARATSWTITDLGNPTVHSSIAMDINNSGQVVGWYSPLPDGNVDRAFLWSDGVLTDLGTLGGSHSYARAINDYGQVVGYSYISGNSARHATMWEAGGILDLGTLGRLESVAYDINDSGLIVGGPLNNTPGEQAVPAVVWENGVVVAELTGPLPASHATAINEVGTVVGMSGTLNDSDYNAMVWNGGDATPLPSITGAGRSVAVGINDQDLIVGAIEFPAESFWRAAMWDSGDPLLLGALQGSSQANDINNLGKVVGFQYDPGMWGRSAYLWDAGNAIDLNSLVENEDWDLEDATAINDLGQIVGHGMLNGTTHAFLLTPDRATEPVPEPGTLLLLGSGLVGLAGYGRKRRKA